MCRLLTTACLFAMTSSIYRASALDATLLSFRPFTIPQLQVGNDNSAAPTMTLDGRYVVFVSSASDLVRSVNPHRVMNVFLCDRNQRPGNVNRTTLISATPAGLSGNGDSTFCRISSNSRYVVFQSDATDLVPGDTNGVSDIFVRDLFTGTTRLVSVALDGGSANGACSDPVMTPDGTCIVFLSQASNLVAGDANGIMDVFARDLITQTTYLVSAGATLPSSGLKPSMATPAITPDGRYVVFWSNARGLVSGTPASPNGEIYVRDLLNGTTVWASRNAAAIVATNYPSLSASTSYHPRISDDGRYVVFKCGSTSSGGHAVILEYDTTLGSTTIISTNGLGALPDEDDAYGPEISPDGNYILYVQQETGSGGSADAPNSSVHVRDALQGLDILVSGNDSGVPTNTCSRAPVMTPDGRYVAFLSNATNLVAGVVSNGFHIYRRDLVSSATQLVDADTNGVASTDDELAALSLSSNGRYVAFSSPDGGLVARDINHVLDVFVRDVELGTNELISQMVSGMWTFTGDSYCSMSQFSVSADGRWVAFASLSDDLMSNDTNRCQDVFLYDLLKGGRSLISVAADGSPALGGWSGSPIMSANGRCVVFLSAATNLVAGQTTNTVNVFLRDIQTGTTTLVSVSTNGGSADNDCYDPAVSQDGRCVVFSSAGATLAEGTRGYYNTFWRDVEAGTTLLLTNYQSSTPFPPSISRDGRRVAYNYRDIQSSSASLRVFDTQLGSDIYTNYTSTYKIISSAILSPDGQRVLYWISSGAGANTLCLDDVVTGTNVLSVGSSVRPRNAAGWSGDGRFLAFVYTTNPNPAQLSLYDSLLNSITVINTNLGSVGSLSAWFDTPSVSGDGRFVAYRAATNTLAWVTNPPPYIFLFDRLAGTNTLLSANTFASNFVAWLSRPAISGSGGTVAFLSMEPAVAWNDLNDLPDAFAAAVPVGAALDSDGDGIPDWWMILHFGHATGLSSDLSRTFDDADGDGMSNWQEWIAGTDPTDPSSRLILAMPSWNASGLTLTWQSQDQVTYYIERSSGVSGAPFSVIQSNIVGQAGMTSFTDTNTAGSKAFLYRVGLQ